MASLEILELLGSATIQDQGRAGYQRFGVPRGGAMDPYAMGEGHALLGNDDDAAALEFQFGGGTFKVNGTMTLATSGGKMEIILDNKPIPWRSTFRVYPEQILKIQKNSSGVYSYLHLPGGIYSTKFLGSRSTHIAASLGEVPTRGYHLQPGSEHPVRQEGLILPTPGYYNSNTIRLVYGPHSPLFHKDDLQLLFLKQFTMSSARNRMGAQIEPLDWKIEAQSGKTLVSDPIVPGDIQVAADGTTAILLADSQPTGGYPRIASVITSDLPRIAQLQPGQVFCFELISVKEAQLAYKQLLREIAALSQELTPLVRDPRNISNLLSYNFISGVTGGKEDDNN